MKKKYIFNIIALLLITNLSAQSLCQEQLVINNAVSGNSIGQSIFMSGCDGLFHSIEFNRSDNGSQLVADLTIFNGQTFIGTPRYTQTVTIPDAAGPFTIDFDGGTGDLAFFENNQYTFMLTNPNLQLETSSDIDSYTEGQLFLDLGFINNDDLWFKLYTSTELGIESHGLKKPSLFPNPSIDYIQISGNYTQKAFVIYDILGTKVKNGIVSNDEKVDIENLSAGLYFLKLNDGNTLKFVKK